MSDLVTDNVEKKQVSDSHVGKVSAKLSKDHPELDASAHRAALKSNPNFVKTVGKGEFAVTEKGKVIASKDTTAPHSTPENKLAHKAEIKESSRTKESDGDFSEKSRLFSKQVHDALGKKNFLGWPDPDVNKIEHILSSMKQVERQSLEAAYEKTYKHPLKEVLASVFGKNSQNFAIAESSLNREDGVTDAIGHLKVSFAQLKEGKDRTHAESDLRHTIAEMPENVLKSLRKDAMAQKLMQDSAISQESRQAIGIMLIPNWRNRPDLVSEIGKIGVDSNRLEIFEDAMRYGDQKSRDYFKNSKDGQALLHSADENTSKIARDYMKSGEAGLETSILSNVSWLTKNKEGILTAVEHASANERDAYLRGEKLKGKEHPSAAEAQDIKFYKEIDQALHRASDNPREYELLRAKLDGKHQLVIDLLEKHSDSWIGGGHDIRKLHQVIEKMDEQQWKALRSRPEYLARIDHALSTFLQSSEKNELMKELHAKIGDPRDPTYTFAKSAEHGDRSIAKVLEQNKKGILDVFSGDLFSGFNDKDRDILDRFSRLNKDECAKLDAKTAKQLEQECHSELAKAIAHRIFERVRNGKSPQFDKLELAAMSVIQPGSPIDKVNILESALRNTSFRKIAEHPSNEYEQAISKALHGVMKQAVDAAGYGDHSVPVEDGTMAGMKFIPSEQARFEKDLFSKGRMPLLLKNQLAGEDLPLNEILNSSVEDRFALMDLAARGSAKELQDKIFKSPEEKQVILDALKYQAQRSSDLQPECLARAFKLDMGISETEMLDRLRALTPDQLKTVSEKYAQHYHSSFHADIMSRVSSKQKDEFGDLLFTKPIWQKILDSRSNSAEINNFLASSRLMDESSNRTSKLFADHREEISHLSAHDRKLLDDSLKKYHEVEQEYIRTKGKNAEQFVEVSGTAMAVVASLINPAASVEFIAGAGAAGAAYRYAALRTMLGKDFDNSPENVKKQLFEGFATTSLCMFGPQHAGLNGMFKLGEKSAAKIAAETASMAKSQFSEGLIKNGGEEVIKKGLAQLPEKSAFIQDSAYLQSIHKIAREACSEGASAEEIMALEKLLKARGTSAVKDGVQARMKHEMKELLRTSATGSIANVGSELGATVAGVKPADTLSMRAVDAAFSGAIGGALGHTAFRSVEEISRGVVGKMLKDKILNEAKFKPTTFESENATVHWNALEQNRVEIKADFARGKTITVEDAGRMRPMHASEKLPIESKIWVNGDAAAVDLDGNILIAKVEKTRLIDSAYHRFADPEGKLTARGERFTKMVADLDRTVPDIREQARIHFQLNRLLSDHPQAELNLDDRIWIAEQGAHQILQAKSITQSGSTCNVTCIENSMSREQPGDYLRIISAGAIEGKLRLSNGRVISGTDIDATVADHDILVSQITKDLQSGGRSFASRIFQQYAIESNLRFRTEVELGGRMVKGDPGDFKYSQDGMYTKLKKNGIPLFVEENGKKNYLLSPQIGTEHLQEIWQQMSGRHPNAPLVALRDAPGAARHPGQLLMNSERQFEELVEQALRTNQPILLGVDVSQQSIRSRYKSNFFEAPPGPAGHLLVATPQMDPVSKQIKLAIFDPDHQLKEHIQESPSEVWKWLLKENPSVDRNKRTNKTNQAL